MEAGVQAGTAILVAVISSFTTWWVAHRQRKDESLAAEDQKKIDRAEYVLDSYHDLTEASAAQLTQCRDENQALRDRLNHA